MLILWNGIMRISISLEHEILSWAGEFEVKCLYTVQDYFKFILKTHGFGAIRKENFLRNNNHQFSN